MAKATPIVHNIPASLLGLIVDLDSIHPLPGNPRRGDVDAVARSYERFGQLKPIVVRADNRDVVAGNTQYAAARQLGWTHIAATVEPMDDATANAFALADNRTSELGTYDEEALAAMLQAVADVDDAALLAATSFDRDDLADLLVQIEMAHPTTDGRVEATGKDIAHLGGERDYPEGQRIPSADSYAAAANRIMVLNYSLTKFVWMQDHLSLLAERLGTGSNSETVERIVLDALRANGIDQ